MNVIWTPEAEQDRMAIWDYLEARDSDAALRIDRLFSDAAAGLADFPMLGHEGEVPGTREPTPHRSYRLVYEIIDDAIWILVLIHTARNGRRSANAPVPPARPYSTGRPRRTALASADRR